MRIVALLDGHFLHSIPALGRHGGTGRQVRLKRRLKGASVLGRARRRPEGKPADEEVSLRVADAMYEASVSGALRAPFPWACTRVVIAAPIKRAAGLSDDASEVNGRVLDGGSAYGVELNAAPVCARQGPLMRLRLQMLSDGLRGLVTH